MSLPASIYYMYKYMLKDPTAVFISPTKKRGKHEGEYWMYFRFSVDDPETHTIMLVPK